MARLPSLGGVGIAMLVGAVVGLLFGLIRSPRGKPGPAWTVPVGVGGAAAGCAGWNALLDLPPTAATGPGFYGGLLVAVLCVVGVQAMKPGHP